MTGRGRPRRVVYRVIGKENEQELCKFTSLSEDGRTKQQVKERYLQILFDAGREVRSADKSAVVRRGMSAERVKEVLDQRGKLTLGELVRCKVMYFTDVAVIGSKAFVNEFFDEHKEHFGANHKDGARCSHEAEDGLHSLRDLKRQGCDNNSLDHFIEESMPQINLATLA